VVLAPSMAANWYNSVAQGQLSFFLFLAAQGAC
jgi:hypothetical protein